jgi:hypothetical protein
MNADTNRIDRLETELAETKQRLARIEAEHVRIIGRVLTPDLAPGVAELLQDLELTKAAFDERIGQLAARRPDSSDEGSDIDQNFAAVAKAFEVTQDVITVMLRRIREHDENDLWASRAIQDLMALMERMLDLNREVRRLVTGKAAEEVNPR